MVTMWNLAIVTGATDDFSSVPLLSPVTFVEPYVFNPPTAYTGVNGLWSVGGFTFALTHSSVTTQTKFSLQIFGTGLFQVTALIKLRGLGLSRSPSPTDTPSSSLASKGILQLPLPIVARL